MCARMSAERIKDLELFNFGLEMACDDVVFQVVICFQNGDFQFCFFECSCESFFGEPFF